MINVLAAEKYKCRAMLDTGSTTTLITTGLLKHMPALQDKVNKTSLTFSGVSQGGENYEGLIQDLVLQLANNIKLKVTAAVIPNVEPFMIIG